METVMYRLFHVVLENISLVEVVIRVYILAITALAHLRHALLAKLLLLMEASSTIITTIAMQNVLQKPI
jgi:hypothetical protein